MLRELSDAVRERWFGDPGVRGRCLDCDYDLQGIAADRCPECGRRFDPRRRDTMNMGAPLGAFGRWALRPIGWPAFALVSLLSSGAFWLATDPQVYYMGGSCCLSLPLVMLAGFTQLTRMRLRRRIIRERGLQRRLARPDLRRWLILWLIPSFTMLLILFQVPIYAGFLVSHRAFERLRRDVQSDPPAPQPTGGERVGIYRLDAALPVDTWERCIAFRTGPEGGFAFSPGGPKEIPYNEGDCGRLWGEWYWFSED